MEMHDLPVCAAFRDDKRDATIRAERRSISHSCYGIQAGDNDNGVRQDHDGMIAKTRPWRLNTQERLPEVSTNPFRFGHNSLATGAQEKTSGAENFTNPITFDAGNAFGHFPKTLSASSFRPAIAV